MTICKLIAVLTAAVLPVAAFASCGAAVCSVNSSWTAESAAMETGSAFELRYEYIDQSQPRSGSSRVGVGEIRRHHDEVSTTNQNFIASYSKMFSSGWGVSVAAPLIARDHQHVHNHGGAKISDRWNFTELGDARVTGRYQQPLQGNFSAPATAGVSFGIKLPTGSTTVANGAGSVAERSLQPGTGTSDAIIGVHYHQKLPKQDAAWFAQVQYQRALNSHANYRPGAVLGVDVGLRKSLSERVAGLLQVNLVTRQRDGGSAAEPADSGGRSVFLSPGLAVTLGEGLQVVGFYQQPLYQYVNGVQLTMRRAFVLGLSGRF
jgi:hypothetical protein